MSRESTLAALADLGDEAQVTITVRAQDLRRAMERNNPGPEMASTTWLSKNWGFSSREWREWAPKIPGAKRDSAKRWRLPIAAAREHFENQLKADATPPTPPRGAVRDADPRVTPIRRKRRGPWKKAAQTGGAR